jgi:hypothetical protein
MHFSGDLTCVIDIEAVVAKSRRSSATFEGVGLNEASATHHEQGGC